MAYSKNLSDFIETKLIYDFQTQIKIIIVITKVLFMYSLLLLLSTCISPNVHYQLNINDL